jgi:hypothetical protein
MKGLQIIRPFNGGDVVGIINRAREAGVLPGPDPSCVEVRHEEDCVGRQLDGYCSCVPVPDIIVSYKSKDGCKGCPMYGNPDCPKQRT